MSLSLTWDGRKPLYLESALQNFATTPTDFSFHHNWRRQEREVLIEVISSGCRCWSTVGYGAQHESESPDVGKAWGGERATAHYAWKCAEEEQANRYFRRACSAARCKGYSRHFPEKDLSWALTLAEIRHGRRHFANNLLSNFSQRKTCGIAPLQKKNPTL